MNIKRFWADLSISNKYGLCVVLGAVLLLLVLWLT